ncbi:MORN repeat-containing protein [Aureibacter tunicatorum]|uniref:MORN repeat protein n=1 Tax=Aureibacter tunicatorum TaxID=866807 RepID=A0AAE3XKI6_9BACT|nr:hypothetical protein [Aureibacter tunicatorum]MDR6237689.1 hypothetical protein [Aureibacter tunicatorum]BDD02724.1 hypothetical protein AUTU_02070 [Aureibacter tunicatorum]
MKKYLYIIILGLAGIASYFTYQHIKHLKKKINMLEKTQTENKLLELKLEADSLLIVEEYEQAIHLFHQVDSIYNSSAYTKLALDFIGQQEASCEKINDLEQKYHNERKIIKYLRNNQSVLHDSVKHLIYNNQVLESNQGDLEDELFHTENEIVDLQLELAMKGEEIDKLQFKNQDDVTINYIGEVSSGKANGFGYAIFAKKGFYEGHWKDNKRNGEGTYSWINGDRYEGNFEDGIRTGYGIYYFNSGEKYEGFWSNNLRDGFGVIFNPKGEKVFEGNWKQDKPSKK